MKQFYGAVESLNLRYVEEFENGDNPAEISQVQLLEIFCDTWTNKYSILYILFHESNPLFPLINMLECVFQKISFSRRNLRNEGLRADQHRAELGPDISEKQRPMCCFFDFYRCIYYLSLISDFVPTTQQRGDE